MGEFAWAFMEPEEGKYQFDWLEKNVALAAQNGMKVILCTPTATPPVWLSRKHPEILMVDAAGTAHESRRAAAGRLELAGVSRVRDQDHHRAGQTLRARQARVGLAARQRTEPLRQAVLLLARGHAAVPRLAAREVRHHRPAEHRLGHRLLVDGVPEFRSDRNPQPTGAPRPAESARAAGFQPLVRRRRPPTTCACRPACCGSTAPISGSPPTSWRCTAMSIRRFPPRIWTSSRWTHYPVHGDLFPENGPLGFRLGNGAIQSFMHDFMRPINGISGLMELQPGQVNWGAINPWPQPGRDPHVDPARVRRGRADRVHLPLPAAAVRQRTVSQGAGGDRRRHAVAGRPRVCRGHARRHQPARQISAGREGAGRVRRSAAPRS